MSSQALDPALLQRMTALGKAQAVRCERAHVKRRLKAGRLTLADALEMACCENAKVWDLVMACPKIGRVKAAKTISRAQVGPNRHVGDLTSRQKKLLCAPLYSQEHPA